MATRGFRRGKTAGAPDRAEQQMADALQKGRDAVGRVEDEVRGVGGRAMLREAPYAGIGLGHVVAETLRDLDATSVPERLRRTPGAVASKVNDLGTNVKVSYLALAARGRGVRLSSAGGELPGEVRKQTKAAVDLTKDTATSTRDAGTEVATEAVTQTGDTAAATGGKVKGMVGKLKGAATKPADEPDEEAAGPTTTPESAADTGVGPLETRTVAQLRERASELGIRGRTSMNKKDLVKAIREAM